MEGMSLRIKERKNEEKKPMITKEVKERGKN